MTVTASSEPLQSRVSSTRVPFAPYLLKNNNVASLNMIMVCLRPKGCFDPVASCRLGMYRVWQSPTNPQCRGRLSNTGRPTPYASMCPSEAGRADDENPTSRRLLCPAVGWQFRRCFFARSNSRSRRCAKDRGWEKVDEPCGIRGSVGISEDIAL